MKRTNFILAFLFNMILGIILMSFIGLPFLGIAFGAIAYLPLPTGVFGENIVPGTQDATEKEKELLGKISNQIKKALDDREKGLITQDLLDIKLESLNKSIDELKENSKNTPLFQKSIDDIYKQIEMIKQVDKGEYENGFMKALKDSYESMKAKFNENPDLKSVEFAIKALPLTTGTWAGSTNYPFKPEDQEGGYAAAPRTPNTFLNDISVGAPMSANSDTWTWIERGTIVNNTGTVAEGSTYGTVEVAFSKKEAKVKKIGNYTKITREMLEDWNEFLQAITELVTELNNEVLSTQIFSGGGTGNDLLGIKTISVEFDANGITESNANIFDSIKAAITQIYISGKTKWMPNKIYMHPADVTQQEITKDTQGNYLFPPFLLPNGMTIEGIQIIKTTDVDQGYFMVCDLTRAMLRFKRQLEVRVWEQNEDDVLNDRLTITGSLRAVLRVKTIEYAAFIYDSFVAAIAILKGAAASLAAIQAMAVASDASKLTINLLIAAGVTGTVAADLDAYKVAVAAETSIADLAALQTVINGA